MPQSISIREVKQFKIPKGKTEIEKSSSVLGSIKKLSKTITVNGNLFQIYKCTYNKDIEDNITVFVEELDKYEKLDRYKKESSFNIFYCEKKKIIFSDSTTPITKGFLKELKTCKNVVLEYKTPNFKLKAINSMLIKTKGIGFTSNDKGINSKTFYGEDPVSNNEATQALDHNESHSLMGVLDIRNHQYTVQFTQSGSFIAYSNIENKNFGPEYPMLQFTYEVLMKINFFS